MSRLSGKTPVNLADITDPRVKGKIALAANAIAEFANLACITLGLLQVMALIHPQKIWSQYAGWLRSKRTDVPSEDIVRSVIQENFYHNFDAFSNCLIFTIIMPRRRRAQFWCRDVAVWLGKTFNSQIK